jgi:hypothetical protein
MEVPLEIETTTGIHKPNIPVRLVIRNVLPSVTWNRPRGRRGFGLVAQMQ